MLVLVRITLLYAAALCLASVVFALSPLLQDGGIAGLFALPWLLAIGGLLATFDCWRLSRRLLARLQARMQPRWDPTVALYASPGRAYWPFLLALTALLVLLAAASIRIPGDYLRRNHDGTDRLYEALVENEERKGVVLDAAYREQLRQKSLDWRFKPVVKKNHALAAGIGLLLLTLWAWAMHFTHRRDGRPALVIDGHGLDHDAVGRVPWSRVHALALVSSQDAPAPGIHLALLVDRPYELIRTMPLFAQPIEVAPAQAVRGTVVLRLDALECDERRVLNAARRFRSLVGPPMIADWSPFMDAVELERQFRQREQTFPAGAANPAAIAAIAVPPPAKTQRERLGYGDWASIVFAGFFASLGAFQLLAAMLGGFG